MKEVQADIEKRKEKEMSRHSRTDKLTETGRHTQKDKRWTEKDRWTGGYGEARAPKAKWTPQDGAESGTKG